MNEKPNYIGKLLNYNNEVIGNIFCVKWQNRKVYITSSAIVPKISIKQKLAGIFNKSAFKIEDNTGSQFELKHIKSKEYITSSLFYMGAKATYSYISVFELENSDSSVLEPLKLAKGGFYKTLKAELLNINNYSKTKCKILCNSEIGFIHKLSTDSIIGSPIVSYGSSSVLGFYCDMNSNNETRILKAGAMKNIRTRVDFIYTGKVTTVETINNFLTKVYGDIHDKPNGWL